MILYWLKPACEVRELPESFETLSSRHIPLLSLPRLFSTELSTIPTQVSFSPPSSIPSNLVLPNSPGSLSVGLVWASDPANQKLYARKSLNLSNLIPRFLQLAELDLLSLHNLQVGPDSAQFAPYTGHKNVYNTSSLINDFSDTAHIISQLDLVVSVDTAVAHLSASLNCPTWLMLPWNCDYRWLLDSSHSPWYPKSMRIFRQQSNGDWQSVIHSIYASLDDVFMLSIDDLHQSKSL